MNLVRYTLLELVLGGSILSVAWAQAPATRPNPDRDPGPPSAAPAATRPPDDQARPTASPRARRRYPNPPGMNGVFEVERDRFGDAVPRPMARPVFRRIPEEESQEMEAFHQALSKLKSAKDDAAKTSATKELSQSLEKLFQRDLEQREHQVTEIETRVKKLRDQIEKRKKAKDDILSLHLKTIINESVGLGFPDRFDNESDIGPHGRNFQDFQWMGKTVPEGVHLLPPPTPRSE
jgi:hypothetical protein